MKQGSTLFLKTTVLLMGAGVLTLCIFALPSIEAGWAKEYPEVAYLKYPVLIGLAATAIPFFIALYQTLKLLYFVDKNKAFSEASVRALGVIKYCAFIVGGLYALALPIVYFIAKKEDAPGVMVIGLIFTFAPIVIAVFAAVLQRLLRNAIDIKHENDLTV